MKYKKKYLNLLGGSNFDSYLGFSIHTDGNNVSQIMNYNGFKTGLHLGDNIGITLNDDQFMIESYFKTANDKIVKKYNFEDTTSTKDISERLCILGKTKNNTFLCNQEIKIYCYLKSRSLYILQDKELKKVKLLDFLNSEINQKHVKLFFSNIENNVDSKNIFYLIKPDSTFNIQILEDNMNESELIELFCELGILFYNFIFELKINLIDINIIFNKNSNIIYLVNFEKSVIYDDKVELKQVIDLNLIKDIYKKSFTNCFNKEKNLDLSIIKNLFNI